VAWEELRLSISKNSSKYDQQNKTQLANTATRQQCTLSAAIFADYLQYFSVIQYITIGQQILTIN